ncbi:hypothetical protein BH23ACT5_BH23ACT5_04210 [soil metagenome]
MDEPHADLERLVGPDQRVRLSWLIWTVLGVGFMTIVGLAVLWPRTDPVFDGQALGLTSQTVNAQVAEAADGRCSFGDDLACHLVVFEILEGPDAGTVSSQEFEVSRSAPRFESGERVVLNVVPEADARFRYQFADRDRRPVLWALGALFALVVVALGRLKGLAALGGLVGSVFILVGFIAPAILTGRSPVLVAAVGGSAIALLTLYLAHGWNALTHVAAIGTFAALTLTVALSAIVVAVARFSGFASEEAFFLVFVEGLDVSGLILAGTVLGAIGALDDITVTQASTVFELKRANPGATPGELFGGGIRVGRDHIASTVNTLLLAYAGAAMPLLLLFTLSDLPLSIIANSEVVAVEITRTLVGSMGLVAAVPATTWLASRIVGEAR